MFGFRDFMFFMIHDASRWFGGKMTKTVYGDAMELQRLPEEKTSQD